jgi:hypothetical protein
LLSQLNACGLRLELDWNDAADVAGYEKMQQSELDLDDDDLEFMFRHAVPPPSLESMEACRCPY